MKNRYKYLLNVAVSIITAMIVITACGETSSKSNTGKKTIDDQITAEKVDGEVKDIKSDNLVEELKKLGFKEDEAKSLRKTFLQCGIDDIKDYEPTDSNASIDDLISYRNKMSKDKIAMFTIDHRKLLYAALNGEDVYDADKGGFIKNIKDIHVPETEVSNKDGNILRDLTEKELDKYFKHALYYDAFGYARRDNDYMVQCQVYASNDFSTKDWVYAKVWYKKKKGKFSVTAVTIDGTRYK